MPKARATRLPPAQLRARLVALGAERLADALLAWSAQDETAARTIDYLAREGDPQAQADALAGQLTAFKRRRTFYSRRESRAWADTLRAWLQQVVALANRAPDPALSLLEGFVQADAKFLEAGDDSDGEVGAVMREAAEHWLDTAKASAMPTREAVRRLLALSDHDDYGTREPLLIAADRLLDTAGLHQIADHYLRIMAAHPRTDDHLSRSPGWIAAVRLGMVAHALRDPEMYARSILHYSPQPNELQRLGIAKACLHFGFPDRALEWLPEPSGRETIDEERTELLDDILSAKDDQPALLSLRLDHLQRAPSTETLDAALAVAPPESADAIRAQAHQFALDHADVSEAVPLLLALGDRGAAEHRLYAEQDRLRKAYYVPLLAMVEEGRKAGSTAIQVLALRALVLGIVEPGRSPQYRYAARYLHALRLLAADFHPAEGVPDHATFEATLRAQHARKHAFWQAVDDT